MSPWPAVSKRSNTLRGCSAGFAVQALRSIDTRPELKASGHPLRLIGACYPDSRYEGRSGRQTRSDPVASCLPVIRPQSRTSKQFRQADLSEVAYGHGQCLSLCIFNIGLLFALGLGAAALPSEEFSRDNWLERCPVAAYSPHTVTATPLGCSSPAVPLVILFPSALWTYRSTERFCADWYSLLL